jgi:hypothetical protein
MATLALIACAQPPLCLTVEFPLKTKAGQVFLLGKILFRQT